MSEGCTLAAIHSGFDTIGQTEVDTLTDIGIEFIKRLGRSIRAECDRTYDALEDSSAYFYSQMDQPKRIEQLDSSAFESTVELRRPTVTAASSAAKKPEQLVSSGPSPMVERKNKVRLPIHPFMRSP